MFVTYEGSASARFQRAISHKDMMGAETAAFELGSLSLKDALALVALYASAADRKFDKAGYGGSADSSRNSRSCCPRHTGRPSGSSNSSATTLASHSARSAACSTAG